MLIMILSMQRSGTSQLCSSLCNLQNQSKCLGEVFTTSKCRNCYMADPYLYAFDKFSYEKHHVNFSSISNSLKLFNFNFPNYETDNKLKSFLLHPDVCPVILERHDTKAKFCSLLTATSSKDYSGHVKNGVHVHPICNFTKNEEYSFLNYYSKTHLRWYNWLYSIVKPRFHINISFENDIIKNTKVNYNIIKQCESQYSGS